MCAAEPAPELVEAAFRWMKLRPLAEVPFSDQAGGVAMLPEPVGEGRLIERQADGFRIMTGLHGREIVAETESDLVLSRHQAGAGWSTDRR